MRPLEKLTDFVLSNPVSKGIEKGVAVLAEWISTPSHVRAMRRLSETLQAARDGDIEAVKKFLNKERGVDYQNHPFVKTLLSEAAEHGQKEIVRMLLERGASAVGEDGGREPAEVALKNGHLSVVELLHDYVKCKGLPSSKKLKQAFLRVHELRAKDAGNTEKVEQVPSKRGPAV